MSYRDAFLADPLFLVLTGRGMSRADAFDVVEEIAMATADGEDEMATIIRVLGSCPQEIRKALEAKK